jgi:hypothetical protein
VAAVAAAGAAAGAGDSADGAATAEAVLAAGATTPGAMLPAAFGSTAPAWHCLLVLVELRLSLVRFIVFLRSETARLKKPAQD